MLKKLAERIWISLSDHTAFGHDIGTRSTLIETGDGLFVHSPLPKLADEIGKIGAVKYVVIPNKWRGKGAAEFKNIFPEALFYGAPDLEKTEKNLSLEPILDGKTYPWSNAIEHLLIQGSPFFNEVAFFHKSSKTLLLADHGGYMYDGGPLTAQLGMKLLKAGEKIGWTTQEKKLYIRDKKIFEDSMNRVFAWDFQRVLIAHGAVLDPASPDKLKEALAFQ